MYYVYRHYYDCFFKELKSLGDVSEPIFSFEDLQKEYDQCYPYGFVMGCAHSQVIPINLNFNFDILVPFDYYSTCNNIN